MSADAGILSQSERFCSNVRCEIFSTALMHVIVTVFLNTFNNCSISLWYSKAGRNTVGITYTFASFSVLQWDTAVVN